MKKVIRKTTIKTWLNYDHTVDSSHEVNDQPFDTVPGEAESILDIVHRYSRGEQVYGPALEYEFEGDGSDGTDDTILLDAVDRTRDPAFDLVDADELRLRLSKDETPPPADSDAPSDGAKLAKAEEPKADEPA